MSSTPLSLAIYEYAFAWSQFKKAKGLDILFCCYWVGRAYKKVVQARREGLIT